MAVLLPCTLVSLVTALYFPARLNAQAEQALRARARMLGRLSAAAIAPTLKLLGDGLARPQDIDPIFEGAVGQVERAQGAATGFDLKNSEIEFLALLRATGPSVRPSPQTVVREAVHPAADGTPGRLPDRAFDLPPPGVGPSGRERVCAIDDGDPLVVRCRVADGSDGQTAGLLIAGVRKDRLRAAQRENAWVGLWIGLGAAGLGLVLAFAFSRALAAPVLRVSTAAQSVAAGDVTTRPVEVTSGDELGTMARSFNEMLATLSELVRRMVALSGQLSTASSGLVRASHEQDDVTGRQAAYAQQIAATFEELSRTAEQISTSTEVVETAARDTNLAVDGARAVFTQLVADIRGDRAKAKEVADAIVALQGELKQVSKIAHLINGFADRSDLLALNAGLEGTKAGEAGRGFSLVAEELRRLAENVGASSADIARIVERVQTSGDEAMAKALGGVSDSDQRVELARSATQAFERIVEMARGTQEATRQISQATRQQRSASHEAVQGAQNVNALVKLGVDATRRTTQIADELQGVARALTEVTHRFRVG
jgi:methyl-accepting chemotaxis protein